MVTREHRDFHITNRGRPRSNEGPIEFCGLHPFEKSGIVQLSSTSLYNRNTIHAVTVNLKLAVLKQL